MLLIGRDRFLAEHDFVSMSVIFGSVNSRAAYSVECPGRNPHWFSKSKLFVRNKCVN